MQRCSKTWKNTWQYALGLVVLLVTPSSLANTIKKVPTYSVYHEQLPDRFRLLVEADQKITFHLVSSTLSNDLIIEITGNDSNDLVDNLVKQIPADSNLVHHIYRQNNNLITQLQLTFNNDNVVNAFELKSDKKYGYGLVIDIFSSTAQKKNLPEKTNLVESIATSVSLPITKEATASETLSEKNNNQKFDEFWLETTLNSQPQQSTVLALRDAGGQIFLSEQDLLALQLTLPIAKILNYRGEHFYSLQELGIQAKLDSHRMTLNLQAPINLFKTTALKGSSLQKSIFTSSVGAFLNYDLSVTQDNSNNNIHTSGLFGIGAFNSWGSGTVNFLAQNNQISNSTEWIRLDTQWRKDDPQKMRTLVLGDTFSNGTSWSGGVRFGGIQWGTNYSTQPEFVTLPLMSVAGEAALPSTVDLYVNDALRLQREVPPGPFAIDEIPVVTGAGQTKLIVRDILGREQIITKDFYSSPKMLRKGLSEYSVELGAIRENYGQSSNDYGRMMATTTWRKGFNDQFTLETHTQILPKQGLAGIGIYSLLPFSGIFSLVAATSYANRQQGELVSLALQHQGNIFNFGLETQLASINFMRLGMIENQPLPKVQNRIYASFRAADSGTLNLSYTSQNYLDQKKDVKFFTVDYSYRLWNIGFLHLSALHFLDQSQPTLRASLTIPLSMDRTSLNLSASHMKEYSEGAIQIQHSLPAGIGYGYNLRVGMADSNQYQGNISYQGEYGTYQMEGSQMNGQTGLRTNIRGGVAILGHTLLPSRYIDSSFAVVRVPGFSGVRIYAENQEVARTNSNGDALIPRLRPYERNQISIEQSDLPLDVKIGSLNIDAYPYYHTGVVLNFPVTHTREASFSLIQNNGAPLPVGAIVTNEKGEHFPVGLRGEVFLTDLNTMNQFKAQWQNQSCYFTLEVPENNAQMFEMGEVRCK